MPNIDKCRSYILHNHPHLLGSFNSVAVKIESMGTAYLVANMQSLDLDRGEREVIMIFARLARSSSHEKM